MSLTLGYVWHADGDLCLGPECQNIDEATGDHSTDVHSDDWWEGFEEAGRRSLSSPETTPAGVLALDAERLAAAFQAEIGGPVSAYARERAADLAAEYNRLGGAPKEDWQCQTVGCYLHAGHASEHEPGMCECGADMEAHSGGWTLLHHDQFMEGFRGTPAGVLDEAWAAAEKALREALRAMWPHHTEGVGSSPPSPGDHTYEVWEPFLPGSPDSVAAALAAALGRSGSGGGRG